jgi:hypothetical protein
VDRRAQADTYTPYSANQLAGLLHVGATRARTHLVVIGSEEVLQ